jgi:hypothetical protein
LHRRSTVQAGASVALRVETTFAALEALLLDFGENAKANLFGR